MSKKPKNRFNDIIINKVPKHLEPASCKDHKVSWQFGLLDLESFWCKKFIDRNKDFLIEIIPKLKSFETNSWNELEIQTHGNKSKSKHHNVNVNDIIKDAKKRLEVLKLDDLELLFSLRLEGAFRIWGVRESGYLKILWFDPDHEICPSDK